jgi:F-box-like
MNHADSQKLIDVRRRMKDIKGADFAMRINHETWKNGSASRSSKTNMPTSLPPPVVFSKGSRMSIGSKIPFSNEGTSLRKECVETTDSRPVYVGPRVEGIVAYSPFKINAVTPGVSSQHSSQHLMSPQQIRSSPPIMFNTIQDSMPIVSKISSKRPSKEITPTSSRASRRRAIRTHFDDWESRKRRKKDPIQQEPSGFFGPSKPELPKTIALAVFNFLSNVDIYTASQVCGSWSKVANDEEFWKFEFVE